MNICTAPVYTLKKLNNLFLELTAKNCNQRCSSCYIDFPYSKKVKDFMPLDMIKTVLEDTKNEELYCIYLTGGEPMTHPDFNTILRLCLKRCNVCICTNGSFLNEKKIRFLKKVEDEVENNIAHNQIFFRLSLTHFDEHENDKVKYRGHFRQTISALKNLDRYNFNSVLSVQNYYNLEKTTLKETFEKMFEENEITKTDLQINISYPNKTNENEFKFSEYTDCTYGRILTNNGVYACPFLANDYRGRMGSSFKDYSKNVTAETNFCVTCSANNNFMFAIG